LTPKAKKGMPLKCQRCGHRWDYTGAQGWYTRCPTCKTSVKVHQG
jgi:predicted Zn-ribbon and HTH transcriptional regulator